MARLLQWFIDEPERCSYLDTEMASREVRVMAGVSPGELGALLERGWRRFGPVYFRPACAACDACIPVRVEVASFMPSTSQRRARRHAATLTRIVGIPQVDDERLALYERWHAQREQQRGWSASPLDAERYAFDFAFAHPSVREVAYRDPARDNALVGLGIVDVVPDALSAVYFFWDPDRAPASLGVAHVVLTVEQAAGLGLDFVYLGYRVDRCPSLAYKSRYQPQQHLIGRPDDDEEPVWVRASD